MMFKKVSKYFSQKSNLTTFLLVVLGLLLISARFYWLDRFPGGIDCDEAEVVVSAKTIFMFGKDSSGTPFPHSLFNNETWAGLAGLPSFLLSPYYGLIKFDLFTARLPFIFLSLITLTFFSLLVYKTTRSKLLALVIFAIGLINPWYFVFSREASEAPLALFFIILGTYTLYVSEGRKIYYSLILYIAAFLSYFGAKPLMIIFVPFILYLKVRLSKGSYSKKTIFGYLFSYISVVVLYFLFISSLQGGNLLKLRSERDLVFTNLERFSPAVDELRRASIDFPGKNLVYNKYTLLSEEILKKYTGWLSSDFLFWGGDPRAMYRFENHGTLYLLDIVFILIGLSLFLSKKDSKGMKFIKCVVIFFLVLAPIASSLSVIGYSYFFRSFLLIPVFVFLISYGIVSVYELLPKKFKTSYIFLLLISYAVLFGNFLVFFFFRYPIKEQQNNYINERVLISYLNRLNKSNIKTVVVSTDALYLHNFYLFYNNALNKNDSLLRSSKYYDFDKIVLTEDCSDALGYDIKIIDARVNCPQTESVYIEIQNRKDAGGVFRIFGDKLCGQYDLRPWIGEYFVSDYAIEKMDNKTFCQRWVNGGI